MTDANQAYAKKCGECSQIALKLFLTQVQEAAGKKTYRMLCEECAGRYSHNYQ